MKYCNKMTFALLPLAIMCLLGLSKVAAIADANIWLEPSDSEVTAGSTATFTCKLQCQFKDTHTMQWIVGEHMFRMRRVFSRSVERFYRLTGIRVTIDEEVTCGSGQAVEYKIQTLSFNASSVEFNKTAVQCIAITKLQDATVNKLLISYYGVLLVKDINLATPSQVMTTPTPSPVTTCETITTTITEYVVETVTKTLYSDIVYSTDSAGPNFTPLPVMNSEPTGSVESKLPSASREASILTTSPSPSPKPVTPCDTKKEE